MDNLKIMPMLFIEYKKAKNMLRLLHPVAVALLQLFPTIPKELMKANAEVKPKDFMAGAILAMCFYTVFGFVVQALFSMKNPDFFEPDFILSIFFTSFFLGLVVFLYTILVPKWILDKLKKETEKNLFFATRHLMIHTSAGVPLYDALVSISQEYDDENFNYGEISNEFAAIVKEVRGGKELTQALEESAAKSTSFYYRRLVWQLANANKSGSNIGTILKHMVEFLSKEQETMLKNYGAQLNPIAMFYMMVCIITPTMAIILMAIASSLININVGPPTFMLVLIIITFLQFMFFGMLKSKKPPVSL